MMKPLEYVYTKDYCAIVDSVYCHGSATPLSAPGLALLDAGRGSPSLPRHCQGLRTQTKKHETLPRNWLG